MMRRIPLFIFFMLMMQPALAGNTSGLPVPRFVSLKPAEVNVRTGPGTRYPIQWVYRRPGMPVEVIEEYDVWRKIRDVDGTSGWVHKSMLAGQRTVMIRSKDAQVLRAEPDAHARALLKAETLVSGRLLECTPDWCRLQITGRKGWIEKKYLWGVYPQEIIE